MSLSVGGLMGTLSNSAAPKAITSGVPTSAETVMIFPTTSARTRRVTSTFVDLPNRRAGGTYQVGGIDIMVGIMMGILSNSAAPTAIISGVPTSAEQVTTMPTASTRMRMVTSTSVDLPHRAAGVSSAGGIDIMVGIMMGTLSNSAAPTAIISGVPTSAEQVMRMPTVSAQTR